MRIRSNRSTWLQMARRVCVVLAVGASPGAFAADGAGQRLEALTTGAMTQKSEVSRFVRVPGFAFQHMLPAPQAVELQTSKSAEVNAVSPALQIGFGRSAGELGDVGFLGPKLKWERQPSGDRVTALTVGSGQARGIRLSLKFEQLDPRLQLSFLDGEGLLIGQTSGMAIADQMLPAGQFQPGAAKGIDYVTPVALGDRLTIIFTAPPPVEVGKVLFSVNWVSHLEHSPLEDVVRKNGLSLSCQRNIACASSAEQTAGKSVARMVFSDPSVGGSYTCTGTLLNNRSQDRTPYFLTANHCIDSQAMASTLQTYWFNESASCQGSTASGSTLTLSGGSTLLYTSRTTDTTLLRLGQSAPQGATFAGWDSNQFALNNQILGIHHPRGDIKKISYGVNTGYSSCVDSSSSGAFSCSSATATSGTHHQVRWSIGSTEGGSSGSGLFYTSGGSYYLVGQLEGGSASCTGSTSTGTDFYGRFDVAFSAGLNRWLSPSSGGGTSPVASGARTAVYRFYNQANGAHFFTSSAAERDNVIATLPTFKYEGTAFYAYSSVSGSNSTVFRFYNTLNGSHFFTISAAERDWVLANLPHYRLEGSAWFAGLVADAQSTPLYRFFNSGTGSHFYTISADERDYVVATLKNFRYEGVAYHVWRSQ